MTKVLKKLIAAFLIWLIGGWPTIVFALPQDGQVVGGSGTITEPTATSMQIDQHTQQMIVNWNSFNIGANESVNFTQPSSSAVALNRVIGADPSILLGSLTANGNVFITNGSGVFFGQGSQVDVHGLVATTMDISNQDFLDQNYNFTQDLDNLSSVVNEGNISATSYVGLLAPAVENRGEIITASLGSIDLASGTAATMDFTGDGLIQFEVTQAVSGTVLDKDGNEMEDRVSNKGLLHADGGQIRMSAKDAGDVIRHVVNMEGMIKANSVVEENGKVFLMGGDSGVVNVSGTIDASGDDAGEKGGTVDVQAETLLHSGTILASGDTEGGNVTINANKIQQSGSIEADGSNGAGGEVDIDFSENYIAMQASKLSATGNDADGGTISINGGATGRLFTSGEIDAGSSNGIGGHLELFGNEVLLVAARLDASGDNGGGSIYIGGDFQGQGTVPLSNATTVTGATTINADAKQNGNGGEVVVWSEGTTDFYGTATARGGAVSGNGGTIEVSGKGNLAIAGTTDASAANGVKGTLLLDPKNIIVDDSSGGLPFFDLVDPNANGTSYGDTIATLANGNIVVLDIDDNFGAASAGAVYLYNGATGALINSVTGTSASDQIGSGQGIKELTGGNFVISSPNWDGGATDVGAVTVISGTLGTTVTGAGTTVTTSNSLHGTTASDQVGIGNVTTLSNGNFAVGSAFWDGGVVNAGAVTLVSGTTGQAVADSSFVVSTSNSLHGTTANDQIGNNTTAALSNGNYVVTSQTWDGAAADVGAATLVNGTTGRALADSLFVVSTSNSLHGSTASDQVGRGNITELTGGNYVVISQDWDDGGTADVGAVTLVNASTGAAFTGGSYTVSTTNSLHGSTASDAVGDQGVYALTNGNYVVASEFWDGVATDTGAATWGSGTTGIVGAVTSSNSIVGSTSDDRIARHITVLTNGNFAIRSEFWNGVVTDAGAVTWGDGTTGHTLNGVFEAVSATNSLVGTNAAFDRAGSHGIQALTNGNYVVVSAAWDSPGDVDAGAVTWMNGTTGLTTTGGIGAITTANSLHGTTTSDFAGLGGVTALTNGNYVVGSNMWDGPVTDSGALTLVNGSGANAGAAVADSLFVISTANSLYGTTASDQVGVGTSRELSNGNYVFSSINWDNGGTADAGAVTLIDGSTGKGLLDGSFVVSVNNSLVGTSASAGTIRLETDSTNNTIVAQFKDNTTNRIRVAPLNDPTFALASGDTYTIHSGFITNTLDAGTAVILQASNDITINSAIIANNGGGAGGDLTLQAGRSVLINANITTDDGNLIIIANDLLANGVVDAQRDSGAAAITMMSATTLNTGSGNLTITLRDGAGKTNLTSGDITLDAVTTTGTITVANNGATAGSDIAQNGIFSSGTSLTTMTTANGVITISNTLAAGSLILDANGTNADVNLNSVVTITGGAVTITADDTIQFSSSGNSITATGSGNVFLQSNTNGLADDSSDRINMLSGTFIDAGSGTITLTSTGANAGVNLIGQLTTTNGTASAVTISALETVTLNGALNITGDVSISSDNGIAVNANLTTGGLALEGDADNASDGTDNISFAAGLTIASTGSITLDATNGGLTTAGGVIFNANNGVTVSDSFTSTGSGTVTFDTDVDNNGVGDFTLASGAAMNFVSFANIVRVFANDVTLLGTLSNGAGGITITPSDGGTLGLGDATCGGTCGMTLSGAEVQNITNTTGDLYFGDNSTTTTGNIFIDNLTSANTANLSTGGNVLFVTATDNASLTLLGTASNFIFNTFLQADDGVFVNTDVNHSGTSGNLRFEGDLDNSADSSDKVVFADGVTITTPRGVILDSTTGGIEAAGAFTMNAGFTMNDNFTSSGTGALNFNTGSSGNFTLVGGRTIDSTNNDINIVGSDFNITAGSLNAGTGTVNILAATGGDIGLGDTTTSCGGTCEMIISGAELQNITAGNLILGGTTTSAIYVDNVTVTNSNGITGTVTLNATSATGVVTFDTAASTFNALEVNAGNGISLAAGLTTDVGNMILEGDSDNATGGAISFTAGVTLMSTGSMTLDATNGGLTTAGAVTLNAYNGVTVNDSFTSTGAGIVSVDTDFDDNGVGDFTLASGAAIDFSTFNNALAVIANDVDIQATINTGTAQLSFTTSDAGTMGIGAATCGGTCGMTISGAEFQRLTVQDIQFSTTSGAMYIDSLTAVNTANSTGLVQFNSASDITVSGSTLTFNMAGNGFANGINIYAQSGTLNLNTGVTVTAGGLVLRGLTGVSIASGLTFTAGDEMFLQRVGGNGDITVAGAATFNAGKGITVDENLNASGVLTFNTDTNDDGFGQFAISAGETLTTNNNDLSIYGSDFELNTTGAINAGTGDITIVASIGRTIGVGGGGFNFDIEGVELGNITANNLNIGASTSDNITVSGVTSANTDTISGTITFDATGVTRTVTFSGSNVFENSVATTSTSGTILDGATLASNLGSISITGGATVGSGTATITNSSGTFTADSVTISAGTAIFSNTSNLGNLTLSGGTLTANGIVTVTGIFNWSGTSTIDGSSSFNTSGIGTMSGSVVHRQSPIVS